MKQIPLEESEFQYSLPCVQIFYQAILTLKIGCVHLGFGRMYITNENANVGQTRTLSLEAIQFRHVAISNFSSYYYLDIWVYMVHFCRISKFY